MAGRKARDTKSTPFTFVSIIRFHASTSASCTDSIPTARPALLTTMSGAPAASVTRSASACTAL